MGKLIGFKQDSLKNLTFAQVESLPPSAFTPSKYDIFNGGSNGNVWWLKMRYRNTPTKNTYLVLDYGNIDYIDIYYRDNLNHVGHIRSGTFAPSGSRPFVASEYIFELPHSQRGEVEEVYMRVEATNTLLLPVKLVDGTVLAKSLHAKYVWQIIYIGIAFSLFLFNLLMLVLTRDRLYALYNIRIVALFYVYVLAYLNGYAHFLGDRLSQIILIHAHIFAAIGFIATISFNTRFLELKTQMPGSIRFFRILHILWIGLLIVSFWDFRAYTNRIAHLLVFVTSVAILYVSLRSINRLRKSKHRLMISYTLAWVPICLASVYLVLTLTRVLPFEDYSLKMLTGAAILEGILISLALVGDRLRLLWEGQAKAKQKTLKILQERNVFLQRKVEERTEELRAANNKLREALDFKDKLFSIIAHDMRTPLATLKMVLQLADRDLVDAQELSRLLNRVRQHTEQVQKMMDNLLNWSISQMGIQRYHPEKLELHAFLQEHLALYESMAAEKKIIISAQCPDQVFVNADRNQLALIVRNLIDNALKFTPAEGLIKVDLEPVGQFAHFSIANSGTPISQEVIDRILGNEGKTVESTYGTANEKGTGLGLQLCKEFIKNLQSNLRIVCTEQPSEVNVVFSFEIPLHQSSSAENIHLPE